MHSGTEGTRVVESESESVESHVFSWSRSRESESVFKTAGASRVGFLKLLESESVFQNCWSQSRFFKTAGVRVGFSKLLESELVFQNCWSQSRFFKTAGVGVGFSKLLESESENLLQLPTPMFIK